MQQSPVPPLARWSDPGGRAGGGHTHTGRHGLAPFQPRSWRKTDLITCHRQSIRAGCPQPASSSPLREAPPPLPGLYRGEGGRSDPGRPFCKSAAAAAAAAAPLSRASIPERCPAGATMASKAFALLAVLLLLGSLRTAEGKPISLTYRCPCRFFESNVSKSHIKHLKIMTVPGCSLQIIAKLKHSNKQICIEPKLKWMQEYLEKYLQKRAKM